MNPPISRNGKMMKVLYVKSLVNMNIRMLQYEYTQKNADKQMLNEIIIRKNIPSPRLPLVADLIRLRQARAGWMF